MDTMNPNGTDVKQPTRNGAEDRGPAWSPVGTRIAVVRDREGDDGVDAMAAAGGNPTNRTNNRAYDYGPDWQPRPR